MAKNQTHFGLWSSFCSKKERECEEEKGSIKLK